jgi:hypothetical protein
MLVDYDYSRNMEPVVYRGESCHIIHTTDLAALIWVPSEERSEYIPLTSQNLAPSLFVPTLDGDTFDTFEDARFYWESVEGRTDGPVWSNYGGWVA